jgi:ATP-binding cassette subfamily G (WHITE) protein 2 (SNQ2)
MVRLDLLDQSHVLRRVKLFLVTTIQILIILQGFEALLGNEFKDQIIPCVNNNLVPNGPGYTGGTNQACAGVRGALPGATQVTGEQYLSSLSYSSSHIWRNVGILFAWWFLFVAMTIFFTMRWSENGNSSGFLLVPREKAHLAKRVISGPRDEENQTEKPQVSIASADTHVAESQKSESESQSDTNDQLVRNTSIFTWRNLTYTVKTPSGDRVLLDKVSGCIRPGTLGALMGSSGAGKTTLLDVLAQRKTDGTIKGEVLVDGRPLSVSFQRSAGYCEQLDVHEPLTTVREALEFSALLRQSRDTSEAEKLAYVDTIIDLLELHDLEHTLIGRPGAGLSIEQRKRVTIGVELVSKPSILIFLDEPTSGLDGQAAFNTVRFLRKLADVGQAVLVTIHQPSAQLFAEFDTLLLLSRGGKTVYNGEIGDGAKTIKEYFGRYDAPCPSQVNVAEFMIDVCSGSLSQGKDWHQIWLDSPENKKMHEDLESMIQDAAGKPPGTTDDGHEFATSLWTQIKLVTNRMNVSIYRNTEYVMNKIFLHIGTALFMGFTFLMIGNGTADLQLNLFALFNYIFVAPGGMIHSLSSTVRKLVSNFCF